MSEETEIKVDVKEEVKIIPDVIAPDPYEAKARLQGWVPKEEFRGDHAKWIDAKGFVERGEKIVPIMKERNEHLEKEIREMKESFKEFSEFHRKTEERVYQKALKEIEQKKLMAVESADTTGYQNAELERVELEKTKPVQKIKEEVEPPEIQEFRKANPWYGSDPQLTRKADALGATYTAENLPFKEMLERVQADIRVLHPEKFANQRRNNPASVESVSLETGLPQKKDGHTYENLPPDAKMKCDKWVKSGLLSKEQYVKDYQWEVD